MSDIVIVSIVVIGLMILAVIQHKLYAKFELDDFDQVIIGDRYRWDVDCPYNLNNYYTVSQKINYNGALWVLLKAEDGTLHPIEFWVLQNYYTLI